MRRVLAADVGGTSIRVARIDEKGAIEKRSSVSTPQDPAEGIAVLRRLFQELGPADGCALAVAGGIRPEDTAITQSPNLKRWEGLRPGRELGCLVLNDADAALLGEAWKGALKGCRSAVLLTLGTGVGGGVLADGKLVVGARGCAGEIGHMTFRPDGPQCGCGNHGCLELYASATAVAKAAGTRSGKEAAELARRGEPRARGAFDQAAKALGTVLAGIANLLNPEAICLGGGLSGAFDLLERPLRKELGSRAFHLATESLRIVPATLGGDAGLYGAAAHALEYPPATFFTKT